MPGKGKLSMPQPTQYTRSAQFAQNERDNVGGRSTVRTAGLDAELDAVALTTNGIRTNLSLNQRDDGEIRDGRVKLHTLAPDVLAYLQAIAGVFRGAWVTTTAYAYKDVVTQSSNTYVCVVAHTSGTFATDLAAFKWMLLAQGATAASAIAFTPTATLAAVTVQAAIDESDTENRALSAAVRTDLADTSSVSKMAGMVGWLRQVTGAVATTLLRWLGLQPLRVTDLLSDADIADARTATPTIDFSTKLQAAIDAAYTKKLIVDAGLNLRIGTSLKILNRIQIEFEMGAQLMLATQNMNGIEIGDGTLTTRTNVAGTRILYPSFVPFPGVAQFTSGACIRENYLNNVDVVEPSFYGLNGTRKLFNGVYQLRCTQCDVTGITSQEMHGDGVYAEGTAGVANRTVDCNYDFARFVNSDGNGIVWGANTAGLGAYRPEGYGLTGWGLKIDAVAGANGQNYFVDTPDFEVENTSAGGVWAKGGSALILSNGWMGANGPAGTLPIGIQIDAAFDSVDIGIASGYALRNIINGPACVVSRGNWASDTVTAGTAFTIGADDTIVSDDVTIRQYAGTAIGWSGTPSRVRIGSVQFKANGTDIAAVGGWAALSGPLISTGQTEKTRAYTAAATTTLPIAHSFFQITGATNITTIPPHGVGKRITIQAGAGGITLAAGGNLSLRAPPVAVTAFATISLVCDGATWFDDGRSF